MPDRIFLSPRTHPRRPLQVWVPADLDSALQQLAAQSGRSKTELVILALEDFLPRVHLRPRFVNGQQAPHNAEVPPDNAP